MIYYALSPRDRAVDKTNKEPHLMERTFQSGEEEQ